MVPRKPFYAAATHRGPLAGAGIRRFARRHHHQPRLRQLAVVRQLPAPAEHRGRRSYSDVSARAEHEEQRGHSHGAGCAERCAHAPALDAHRGGVQRQRLHQLGAEGKAKWALHRRRRRGGVLESLPRGIVQRVQVLPQPVSAGAGGGADGSTARGARAPARRCGYVCLCGNYSHTGGAAASCTRPRSHRRAYHGRSSRCLAACFAPMRGAPWRELHSLRFTEAIAGAFAAGVR